ncbi:MAG: BtpA/SgcQ family protein [Chloroflexota bacterium]
MNRLARVFGRLPVVLPVIHVESLDQALGNAHIAHQAGCAGVFLISHAGSHTRLLTIHKAIHARFPDWWIGVNCLDLSPWQVFDVVDGSVAGVWVDNAGIDERVAVQEAAERTAEARAKSGWPGLYFGGVAFKYQRPVTDLAKAAILATQYMDVVTTSGVGTGQAAQLDKIRTMKEAIGDFPLAIASGISPENVGDYLAIADCFLVATGINRSWSEVDPQLLKRLMSAVRIP